MTTTETTIPQKRSTQDPMPPGRLGLWLFLISEMMFFIGILASYVVLRAGEQELFRKHELALNGWLAGTNTLLLMLSSGSIYLATTAAAKNRRKPTILWLTVTLVLGIGFLAIKAREYQLKFVHHTIVAIDAEQAYVYDGIATKMNGDVVTQINGYRAKLPESFDIHRIAEADVRRLAAAENGRDTLVEQPPELLAISGTLSQDLSYGPWKNIFLACYFTLTGVHAAHILGGAIAVVLILGQAVRGRVLPAHIEYLALYWYFVDVVWLILFPLLYLF